MENGYDLLNRQDFVDELIAIVELLAKTKTGCCFAIDGKWGAGKTFVMDMFEINISVIQSEETNDDKFFLFHYNCWQFDYYQEPLVAIISSMLDTVENKLSDLVDRKVKPAWNVAKEKLTEIAGVIVKNHIGINIVELYNDYKNEEKKIEKERIEFDNLFAFKKTIDSARQALKKISEQKSIVIVVDELDRCLPEYAIKILERLHHLFDGINNIIVIIAVDSSQLEHSIKKIYGDEIDMNGYLKKFISFRKTLDTGKMQDDIKDLNLKKYESYISLRFEENEDYMSEIESLFPEIWYGVDMRMQEKLMEKAAIIHNLICPKVESLVLLLFEIVIIRYQILTDNKKLDWLARGQLLPEIKKKIENKQFLLNLINKSQTGAQHTGIGISLKGLTDDIVGILFYILAEVYLDKTPYYLKNSSNYKEVCTIASKFSRLSETMD